MSLDSIGFLLSRANLKANLYGEELSIETKIAIVLVLEMMISADSHVTHLEYPELINTIRNFFDCDTAEVAKLLEFHDLTCQTREATAAALDKLNMDLSTEQRQLVFAAAWKLAKLDGQLTDDEATLSNALASRLDLGGDDIDRAKSLGESWLVAN